MASFNAPVSVQDAGIRVNGMIWGDSKTGKTTYAMSLPGRKLLVNFDPDGFTSIRHRDDVDIIDLSPMTAQDQINEARKVASWIATDGAAKVYDSVVVDSLTTLTEAALHDAVSRKIGSSHTFTPSVDAPGLAAYGARNNSVNDVLSRILRATAQQGKNIFFIAHADDPEYDKKGDNIVQQTIMLSAKIRSQTTLKVSEVYHLELASNNRRFLHFTPYGVKKPMASRMIDSRAVSKLELAYTTDKPDAEQPHALVNIIEAWKANSCAKLTSIPK